MILEADSVLADSAKRLFPDLSADEILATLLLERAQKNLIKYQTVARQFETKYEMSFDTFRRLIIDSEPSSTMEQDYFDWELAITGIEDMNTEIRHLRALIDK